ncbi:MAG: BapA prefix-like domain-containing protein, partial [Rhizobiaceae bacterium]|nr:BapA prefix-like domain-containing protein [Rhizobiaceae bacterium]
MVASSVLEGHTNVNVSGAASGGTGPSNFIVKGNPQDVASYARQGNDLIIQMKNGQINTIRNFAARGADFNNLVFSAGGTQTLVDVSTAFSAVGSGTLPASLVSVSAIGAGASSGALLGILGVAAAGGGIAAVAGGGGGGGGDNGGGDGGDTTAPAKPSRIVVTDDTGSIKGVLSSGAVTDDVRPTFTGAGGEAGATIELHNSQGKVLGSVKVGADGKWTLTPSVAL